MDARATMLEIAVAQIRYALESDDLTPALRTTLTTARSALNQARGVQADDGQTTLWRCRKCGKWSHAKRDPRRHKRWHAAERYDGTRSGDTGWFTWCGPFDRWTAQHDDPRPRGYVFGIGEPVSYAEKAMALGEYQHPSVGEVPF